MIRHSYGDMLEAESYEVQETTFEDSRGGCTEVHITKAGMVGMYEWCVRQQAADAECSRCWMTDSVMLVRRVAAVAEDTAIEETTAEALTTTEALATTEPT